MRAGRDPTRGRVANAERCPDGVGTSNGRRGPRTGSATATGLEHARGTADDGLIPREQRNCVSQSLIYPQYARSDVHRPHGVTAGRIRVGDAPGGSDQGQNNETVRGGSM